MEGGVRHRLLGVVDIQEKSRLHPACTQIPVAEGYRDGTRKEGGDLDAGPAASTRALTNSGPVPSERVPGTGPVGPRVVEGSGGGGGKWGSGLAARPARGEESGEVFSPRSRGDAPSARTGGP